MSDVSWQLLPACQSISLQQHCGTSQTVQPCATYSGMDSYRQSFLNLQRLSSASTYTPDIWRHQRSATQLSRCRVVSKQKRHDLPAHMSQLNGRHCIINHCIGYSTTTRKTTPRKQNQERRKLIVTTQGLWLGYCFNKCWYRLHQHHNMRTNKHSI